MLAIENGVALRRFDNVKRRRKLKTWKKMK